MQDSTVEEQRYRQRQRYGKFLTVFVVVTILFIGWSAMNASPVFDADSGFHIAVSTRSGKTLFLSNFQYYGAVTLISISAIMLLIYIPSGWFWNFRQIHSYWKRKSDKQ